jgi:putative membrane protein
MLMRLIWHWAVLVLGLYFAALLTGISYDSPKDLLWAALVLIIANTILKPLLILFTLPLVLLSLGLFLFVINALILYIVPHFVTGFHVPGFWSAFFGAIIISIITGLFTGYEKRVNVRRIDTQPRSNSGKVIDI